MMQFFRIRIRNAGGVKVPDPSTSVQWMFTDQDHIAAVEFGYSKIIKACF